MEDAECYIKNNVDKDFLVKRYIDTTIGNFHTHTHTHTQPFYGSL